MKQPRRLLLAYALTNAVLYSMLLPLWEGFDEPFHFGYVQSLANGQGFPDPRVSRLSQEVGSSLLLAPGSLQVKRNLPGIVSYPEFYRWPEWKRKQVGEELRRIDPSLRWQPSDFLDYEALQAPLAYAVLALPERALARLPLPNRVLLLRMIAAILGALLLLGGTDRLLVQLRLPVPCRQVALFCLFSSQMIWACLARVSNDWLAVPLAVWLLVAVIRYWERPATGSAALAAGLLSAGLLTKAYFLAFVPLLAAVCILRRGWRHLGIGLLLLAALAGPWYARNLQRYGTISGMQELREGLRPEAAWRAIEIRRLPAAIESYARGGLWTANNTFRTFSISTLRCLIAAWGAALLLWAAARRHSSREWILVLYCGLFAMALAYNTAVNYVASRGESGIPGAWFMQVLVAPMLGLAFLGIARSPKLGRPIAVAMIVLFGYVLAATYWLKLIPLYGGFEGRASIASLAALYGRNLGALYERLQEICLGPTAGIFVLAAILLVLTAAQQAVLIRFLFLPEPAGKAAGR